MNQDLISGIGLAKAGLEKLHQLKNDSEPLVIEECYFINMLPRRIVTAVPINPSLLTDDEMDAVSEKHYFDSALHSGWADECVLHLRMINKGDSPVSIRGIGIEKTKQGVEPKGSMLFIPQGLGAGGRGGEPWRFQIDLDSDGPFVQLFDFEKTERVARSSDNYFDEGSIEIATNETHNVSLYIHTTYDAFSCKPYLSFKYKKEQGIAYLPLQRDLNLYPLTMVPENQRYRRTYSSEPPWIALESDPQFEIPGAH